MFAERRAKTFLFEVYDIYVVLTRERKREDQTTTHCSLGEGTSQSKVVLQSSFHFVALIFVLVESAGPGIAERQYRRGYRCLWRCWSPLPFNSACDGLVSRV